MTRSQARKHTTVRALQITLGLVDVRERATQEVIVGLLVDGLADDVGVDLLPGVGWSKHYPVGEVRLDVRKVRRTESGLHVTWPPRSRGFREGRMRFLRGRGQKLSRKHFRVGANREHLRFMMHVFFRRHLMTAKRDAKVAVLKSLNLFLGRRLDERGPDRRRVLELRTDDGFERPSQVTETTQRKTRKTTGPT